MEPCTEHPQGQVELGSKHKDEESLTELHPGIEQTKPDLDRDHGGAEGGQQLQGQGREERDPQNAQRGIAELVANLFDIPGMGFRLPEKLERG